jgi:hypothetical protein
VSFSFFAAPARRMKYELGFATAAPAIVEANFS